MHEKLRYCTEHTPILHLFWESILILMLKKLKYWNLLKNFVFNACTKFKSIQLSCLAHPTLYLKTLELCSKPSFFVQLSIFAQTWKDLTECNQYFCFFVQLSVHAKNLKDFTEYNQNLHFFVQFGVYAQRLKDLTK